MNERLKLKPEIKALWTAALRSGEYKQGTGRLRDNEDCFCCLGVLCDINSKTAEPVAEWSTVSWGSSKVFGGQRGVPPHAVVAWATGNYSGQVSSFLIDRDTYLTSLNDGGATFTEIANIIDKEF